MRTITIIGTALTICLITIVLAMEQIQLVNTSTEPYRSRTLYVPFMNTQYKYGANNGLISLGAVREIFLKMKTPEAVAVYMSSDGVNMKAVSAGTFNIKTCNRDFFRLYKLRFIAGRPCSENPSKKEVLLSESTCKKLLRKTEGALGQTVWINRIPYRVCGITKDVTPTNREAVADAWIGYNFKKGNRIFEITDNKGDLYYCLFNVNLLLRHNRDEATVRKEMAALTARLQKRHPECIILFNGEPERRESYIHHTASNEVPDMQAIRRRQFSIYLMLLIVPALNLMSIALSSFSRQEGDIRIMRVYGASRRYILGKIVRKSLLNTLTGGALGLLMTILLCHLMPEAIFYQNRIDLQDILRWPIMVYTLIFCLLLNLLSTLLPAWRASHRTISPNN